MSDLHRLTGQAMELAAALFKSPPCADFSREGPDGEFSTCLTCERARPLRPGLRKVVLSSQQTAPQFRPFNLYDAGRLCGPCRCYWYAEMAAQELQQLALWKAQEAAVDRLANQDPRETVKP
jgi:hypothetical protein